MKKLSGQRLALIATLLWVMGCFSVFLFLGVINKGLGITELLVFVYIGLAAPFSCWLVYWLVLGFKLGIIRKLLGHEESEFERDRREEEKVERFVSGVH